jgi:hypothetical protein
VGVIWREKKIPVTRYVCASCGFTEEWIEPGEDLDAVKENYEPL